MNSSLIKFILESINKSSRFLYRDYFELEMQQSSKIINQDFVKRSYDKCQERLKENLSQYTSSLKFEVIPIDGKENFSHAIPFFGIVVVAYKDSNADIPDAAVIDFPVLGETYFVEKGDSAWTLNHNNEMHNASRRLKTSKRQEDILLITDSDNPSKLKNRNFGCAAYSICMVAAGKADAAILSNTNQTMVKAAKLFISEAGGKIISDKPLILTSSCCKLPE